MPCSVIFGLALLQSLILVFSGISKASSAGTCDGSDETCTAVPGILTFSQERLSTLLEKIPCNVERIDAHEMDAKKFEEAYRTGLQPLIVRNWTGQWRAHSSWQDGGFLEHLGDLELSIKQQQVVQGHDNAIGRMTVEQYLTSPQKELMFDTADWSLVGSRAKRDIFPLPEALETVYQQAVYTIGRNGTGSTMHQHEEAWISQVVGIKVWVLAPELLDESGTLLLDSELGADGMITKVKPCELLHRLAEDRASFHKELQACAVGPGETVYIPTGMHHATCNFGDVTVGVGARGNSTTRTQLLRYVERCDLEKFKAHAEKYGDLGLDVDPENLAPQQDDGNGGDMWPHDTLLFAGVTNCVSIVEYLIARKEGVIQGIPDRSHTKTNTTDDEMAADRTLYVRNLNDKINLDTMRAFLYALFSEIAGGVVDVIVLDSLEHRGQALIIFERPEDIEESMQVLQDWIFFSKPLKLTPASSKKIVKTEDLRKNQTASGL